MPHRSLTRRSAIAGTAALGSAGMLPPSEAATTPPTLRLEDPRERARILAKIKGSCGEETVYTFCRLHLYLYLNDGNLKPMVTMQNLNASTWKPLPNGNYQGTVREVGAYTAFDTDELIDHWVNPVTGEKREVWQF